MYVCKEFMLKSKMHYMCLKQCVQTASPSIPLADTHLCACHVEMNHFEYSHASFYWASLHCTSDAFI